MEKLNKDELFSVALYLNISSLLNFCNINKYIQKNLYHRNEIWIYKLNKDFPDFRNLRVKKSFKDIYQILFSVTKLKEKLNRKENIYSLYILENFNLNKKKLTKIPKETGTLMNLRTLYLYCNFLTEIPKEICNLISLQTLDLSSNRITQIPKEIGGLINLKTLSLCNNKLTTIPKEIGGLINLKTLLLFNNLLNEIPKEINQNKIIIIQKDTSYK